MCSKSLISHLVALKPDRIRLSHSEWTHQSKTPKAEEHSKQNDSSFLPSQILFQVNLYIQRIVQCLIASSILNQTEVEQEDGLEMPHQSSY